MTESALLYYPNPQHGVVFSIELEDNRKFEMTDFSTKIQFTVEETTSVREILLTVLKGHACNGMVLKPKLYKSGTTTNLITGFIDSSTRTAGGVNNTGVWFTVNSDLNSYVTIDGVKYYGTHLTLTTRMYEQNKKPYIPKVVASDTVSFRIANSTSGIILTPGTYILDPGKYNANHWDVAFGYTTENGNSFRPNGVYPKLHNALYVDGEILWEKEFGDKIYYLGDSSPQHHHFTMNEEDGSMVRDNMVRPVNPQSGATQSYHPIHVFCSKNYFIGARYNTPQSIVISKNLKDWVITEINDFILENDYNSPFNVSRNEDVFLGAIRINNEHKFAVFTIHDNGKVTWEIKNRPTNYNSRALISYYSPLYWYGRSGMWMYVPKDGDPANIYDNISPLWKPYYGIDVHGNMYNTNIARWVASGSSMYKTSGIIMGWDEDIAFEWHKENVSGVSIGRMTVAISKDGFKTRQTYSPFQFPGYNYSFGYEVPGYGARFAFSRTDLELHKTVYDVYDARGNLLEYNVQREIEFPLVGWIYGHDVTHKRTINWEPRSTGPYSITGTGSWNMYDAICYTEGNGPVAPKLFMHWDNPGMLISAYDRIGRPDTSKGQIVAVPKGRFECNYIESCYHPGKHWTTSLAI